MADRQILRQQRSSLIAAAATGDAGGELLRFHMEGARCNWPFGDEEPVAKLAEALLRTARIESEILECQPSAASYRSDLGQLAAACAKFLADQSVGIPLDLLEDIHESEEPS
ncbi:hypothetical protein [Novosphingobium sp. BL-52-GroH]|uniref:hypothetical protein n=1 Tax=Novosphingobium sp. BL-52-GroH TaxID=3349877 RepID=UPI00384F858E